MSFVAVAVGGAVTGIAGSAIQAGAAGRAARGQQDAANKANQMQWDMYQQTRSDQEPWRQAGQKALGDMGNADFQRDFTAGDFQKDPGYDFRMAEGQKALERSAAARGGLQSGGTMKGLARYGQDYASGEYQNAYNRFNGDRDRRFNRLSSLAGMGQTANSTVDNAGMNYANQAGQNAMGAANAKGAAGMASAGAWGNTLSGIGQLGMEGAMMSKMSSPNWMSQTESSMGGGGGLYSGGRTFGLMGRG